MIDKIDQNKTAEEYVRRDRIRHSLHWRYWPTSLAPDPDHRDKARPILHPGENWEDSTLPSPSQISSHPELEDDALITWGLANSSETQNCGIVDYCEVKDDAVEWSFEPSDDKLEELGGKEIRSVNNGRSFRVFFLNTLSSDKSWLPGNFNIRPRILKALLQAGLSRIVLGEIFTFEGSFAKMGGQCFQKKNEKGNLTSFEVCYRNHCGWDTGVGYIQSIRNGNQTTYFCINYPSRALDRFMSSIKANPSIAYRDFHLDLLAAEDACRQWRFTIGQRRNKLLMHESRYEDGDIDYYDLTRQLHRLTRDWNTLNQDCFDFIDTLDFLGRAYAKFSKEVESNGWVVDRSTDMRETLEVLKSQCENCARWTAIYKERTNIRINLIFHLANQREARNSKQIAISTAKVAEQSQRDSASMITMAAVTMLFLPGTFISTILSTTFFQYGENRLDVSKQWWVLPASTIPTTIAVLAVWVAWRGWRLKKRAMEIKKHDAQDLENKGSESEN